MDFDPANGAGFGEADERPRDTRIDRLPDAATGRRVPADVRRARADVDGVRVGVGNVDRADRAAEKAVGDVLPRHARVFGFPDAAAGRADEERVRLRGKARDSGGPATAKRTEQAESQAVEQQ